MASRPQLKTSYPDLPMRVENSYTIIIIISYLTLIISNSEFVVEKYWKCTNIEQLVYIIEVYSIIQTVYTYL
jgi:hypothetical protein